tara:strand:+ start:482 stop:1225 length:744 start_codon:yes stop_codon:yes gene_type:complete
MDVRRLIAWAVKASSLREKYEREKAIVFVRLFEEAGVKRGLFSRKRKSPSNPQKTMQDVLILRNIVARRQLPLYNNMVNYANMASGMLPRKVKGGEQRELVDGLKRQLALFITDGAEIRKLLETQINILSAITVQNISPDFLRSISKLWNEERKRVKRMGKSASIMQGVFFVDAKRIEKMYLDALSGAVLATNFLRDHKQTFMYLQAASIGVMAIGAMVGLDTNEVTVVVRKIGMYGEKLSGMVGSV